MISPVILFNGIMSIIGSLQVFTVPFIMFPNGSPARSTFLCDVPVRQRVQVPQDGYASAMGWIMFVIILVLTLTSMRLSEKHVHYQAS